MSSKQFSITSILWFAFTTAIVFIPNISPWVATPIVLIALVLVLGFLWSVNLHIRSSSLITFFLYSVALGLSFLLIGGLAINFFLPLVGIIHPLAKIPLVFFLDLSALILAWRAYYFKNNDLSFLDFQKPDVKSLFFGLVPFLFVIMSAVGAELLNNGGTGTLTLIMLFSIGIYVLALVLWGRPMQEWAYLSALYFIALALLLMYSLRTAHILGWDINQEYEVFQMTLQHLAWKPSYYPGLDYNACLSITILPTIFKVLTNTPSEYVFKFTFQLLFALVPVTVYAIARRYITENLAFLAAFLVTAQTWFYEQMPALIRQEVAFIFYGLIILTLFDSSLSKRARYLLFYIFSGCLIISHYSTAYVWLALMCGVLILSYVLPLLFRSLKSRIRLLTPAMLLFSFVLLFIWQVPLTRTTGKITDFVTNNNGQVQTTSTSATPSSVTLAATAKAVAVALSPAVVPVVAASVVTEDVVKTALFASDNPNTDQNAQEAQTDAITRFVTGHPTYQTFADATSSGYVPIAINDSISVPSLLPSWLSVTLNILSRISKILLIDIFPLVGGVVLYFGLSRTWADEKYNFLLLNIGAYILIVVMLLIPYSQEYYNLTRLYLQMFFTLGILSIIGGVAVAGYLPKYRMLALTLLVIFTFYSLSGALDQVAGGQAQLTLDQPPSTLDVPYLHDSEITSAEWLAANRTKASPIQADFAATLRLQSFAGTDSSNSAIFPLTIERDSYVYLITQNIQQREAFYVYDNNLLVFSYPVDFLDSNKNLIYNDGGSRIYR